MPEAFLSRTDLAALGLPRRAVDAVFRELDVVVFPGFSRPFVRVADSPRSWPSSELGSASSRVETLISGPSARLVSELRCPTKNLADPCCAPTWSCLQSGGLAIWISMSLRARFPAASHARTTRR